MVGNVDASVVALIGVLVAALVLILVFQQFIARHICNYGISNGQVQILLFNRFVIDHDSLTSVSEMRVVSTWQRDGPPSALTLPRENRLMYAEYVAYKVGHHGMWKIITPDDPHEFVRQFRQAKERLQQ